MLAGKLVFISGRLFVAGVFVVPPIVLLAPLILELVAEVSVELPGLFWLQPTSANAATTVIADSVIIDFISSLFSFFAASVFSLFPPRQRGVRRQGRDRATGHYFFMAMTCCK